MPKSKPSTQSAGRRKAIKKMAIGGTAAAAAGNLPDRWGKPLVDSVLLPTHAEFSPKSKKSKKSSNSINSLDGTQEG